MYENLYLRRQQKDVFAMIKLRDKELEKLSSITDIPLEYISKLHAMGIFNESAVIGRLMCKWICILHGFYI